MLAAAGRRGRAGRGGGPEQGRELLCGGGAARRRGGRRGAGARRGEKDGPPGCVDALAEGLDDGHVTARLEAHVALKVT
jgi:hypothetical protein